MAGISIVQHRPNGAIFFSVPSKIEFSHILILSLSLLCLPPVSAVKQSVRTHTAQRESERCHFTLHISQSEGCRVVTEHYQIPDID